MTRYLIIAALAIGVLSATYAKGRIDERSKQIRQELVNAEKDAAANEKLAALEEANRKLSRALEDQVYDEPPSNPVSLPMSRVLRLNER